MWENGGGGLGKLGSHFIFSPNPHILSCSHSSCFLASPQKSWILDHRALCYEGYDLHIGCTEGIFCLQACRMTSFSLEIMCVSISGEY